MRRSRRLHLSTGLPGLDRVFRGLMPGDNIVWQVDSIDDYQPFVDPYCRYAEEHRERVIYFRFAAHRPLLDLEAAETYIIDPQRGFDAFLSEIHRVIDKAERGRFYLFDSLSELASDWRSDRMLGNFFMLTCPYLYDRAAIAYFAVLRNYHSFHALNPIAETTQILVNAYRHRDKLYVHPLKVQHRHSNTMYTIHVCEGEDLLPVTQSGTITEILRGSSWLRIDASKAMLGYWTRTFAEAEAIQRDWEHGLVRKEQVQEYFQRILRMLISHDRRMLDLAERYLTLKDLLDIRRRMIGTGLIGGKSVGMLLARAILQREDPAWRELLEQHDSFYVGSDVFYTYLVQNGYWWMVKKSKESYILDDSTEIARRRMLTGEFPEYIIAQFADMLEYFGQSPIIVRSSSLLEDNFGNAFAGKYESVFCANQGGPDKRLEDFLSAVKTVYASTMSEDALAYRFKRKLLAFDEQMGLLIQRVSGATYGPLFFPQASGVGFSFNPWVWHNKIDPEAGVVRLVFGMGTRAVERSDDDYTRIVALNAPERRPEATADEVRDYAQRRVDVIDLDLNYLTSKTFEEILRANPSLPVEMFASTDFEMDRQIRERGVADASSLLLTFEKLLRETAFVPDMRSLLRILQTAYQWPVDVEFTLNFFEPDRYQINIVQCRPLQVDAPGEAVNIPDAVPPQDLIFSSVGSVIGRSNRWTVDWVIYVVPEIYSSLSVPDRYLVARLIADAMDCQQLADATVMLIGPGRWGTTTPSLGVPVAFHDISSASILCELVTMGEHLVPDVSLGTHFFNELVENDMLYVALFPRRDESVINSSFLAQAPNSLSDLLPEEAEWGNVLRIIDAGRARAGMSLVLRADMLRQRILCCWERLAASAGPPAALG